MAVFQFDQLTLSVADNLNGTVTATVSGDIIGDGADAVRIFAAEWNSQAGSAWEWKEVAAGLFNPVTGIATVGPIASDYGFFSWTAVWDRGLTSQGGSPAVFRPVVDPADPIHNRILDAVVTLIRSLNLAGVGATAAKVFKRWVPRLLPGTDTEAPLAGDLPIVQVGPYPKEVPLGLLTNRDDVGYPVLVAFFDAANQTQDNDMPRNLKWRRQVAAAFRAQQLAGVPEVVLCDWQPDLVVAPDGILKGLLVGAEGFVFRSRESRGLIP